MPPKKRGHPSAKAAFKAAAAAAIERVRQDHLRAPKDVKPILAYLEQHLFDPELNVSSLYQACGISYKYYSRLFAFSLGARPGQYIEARRLEVAAKLLRETNHSASKICEMVGYSGLRVFSQAFNRWAGIRPHLYRSSWRHTKARKGTVQAATGEESPAAPSELEEEPPSPLVRPSD